MGEHYSARPANHLSVAGIAAEWTHWTMFIALFNVHSPNTNEARVVSYNTSHYDTKVWPVCCELIRSGKHSSQCLHCKVQRTSLT